MQYQEFENLYQEPLASVLNQHLGTFEKCLLTVSDKFSGQNLKAWCLATLSGKVKPLYTSVCVYFISRLANRTKYITMR
jgi:hypothetical protein